VIYIKNYSRHQPATSTKNPTVRQGIVMKFGHIEIYSRDPERTLNFYRDVLGFEVLVVENTHFIWLKKDDIEILIRPGEPPRPATRYEDAPTGFVLYTHNIETLLADLVEKGLELRGTVDSDNCYTFTDPDGNWFQLVDPMEN
jgi:catechol 2,3-dioxygenase-like lactoylglutathione lyase family enzyme